MIHNPFARISHFDISVIARAQGRGNENLDARWHEIQIISSLQFLAMIVAIILAFTLVEDWMYLTAAGVSGGAFLAAMIGLHKMARIKEALGREEILVARNMRLAGKTHDEIRGFFKSF